MEYTSSSGGLGKFRMQTDALGIIHASAYDSVTEDLMYQMLVPNSGNQWNLSTVDSVGKVGYLNDIFVDESNMIHIAYYDSTNQTLKYANKPSGMFLKQEITVDFGPYGEVTGTVVNDTTILVNTPVGGDVAQSVNISLRGVNGTDMVIGARSLFIPSAVDFRGANLSGVDFRGSDLSNAELVNAIYDSQTIWPVGFDPDAAGAVGINTQPVDLNSTASLSIAENQPVGTIVGEFNATDPEGGAVTYYFVNGENNNSLFTLDTNGTLKTATTFDYESNASTYTITVQAKDEYNASVEGNFTVTVLEVYEPFTNVATEAGITTGGTGAWGDFDNDGDVDLFVSSKLYGNEGNGTFTASSQEFSGGSAIWVDVDNDGELDLYTHANS